MLIDGTWLDARRTAPSLNPATGESLAEVAQASDDDVASAVAAARASQPAWNALGVTARSKALEPLLDDLRSAYGEEGKPSPLKDLICEEVGKRLPEADVEVAESGDMVEYFIRSAGEALASEELVLDASLWPSKRSHVVYEAVGVIAVVKPWNYPLELPLWSIVPALLAGNAVVFKPAPESALVGLELARMLHSVLPPGVLNVVTGGADAGRALVGADVDMISFTGSVQTGREIAAQAGSRLKRCALELGGNDAALVAEDADLDLAASGLVWGCFANGGQVCVRPKRVLVHEGIADALLERIMAKVAALRVDVDWGPLISDEHLARVATQVEETVRQGAAVAAGGKRLAGRTGFYYEPTVLTGVTPRMTVASEECFGPVMPVIEVPDMQRGCEVANDSQYGLGASVWTSDLEAGRELARRLAVGMVWLNDVNVAFPQAPWGGVKCSGWGRELGCHGFREYVTTKHLSVEESNAVQRDWWFPY